MKKVIRLLFIFISGLTFLSFIEPPKARINWISLSKLNEVYAANPKPILVDVYTDWCGWCREMERITYHNKKLVAYVNQHYYAVKLDAESPDSLVFNNRQFGYNATEKTNELAAFLLSNRMEFPTTVFLPAMDAQPAPLAGYMNAREMEAPLKYFAEGSYRSKTFIEFNKGFKGEW